MVYAGIHQDRQISVKSIRVEVAGESDAARVRTEDELEDALAAASNREALVLIELVMSRLDAPGPLVNFARKCAEFNFPQLATIPGLAC
jgi:TPP-dependent 2-oxoacid decarboxylase